jgi:tetratricopeptide (TPR) repeat protein
MIKHFVFGVLALFIIACGSLEEEQDKHLTLDQLVQKYPDSIPLLQKRANRSLDSSDFKLLLADAAHAFRLDSTNLENRLLYALALINKKEFLVSDFNSAQYHFGRVIKKDPKNLKAIIGMASVYSFRGDLENSFKLINKVLRINPRYRDAYILKGSIYLSQGNYTLAKSSYETAVQQDNKFFLGYMMLGTIYQFEKNPLCIEYFTTASRLKPKNAEVMYSLAYATYEFGDKNEAKFLYRKMGALDSTYCEAYFHLGYIQQFDDQNLDSAMFFYSKSLDINPKHIETLHNLGLIYEDKGDVSNALLTYAKVLKVNPEYQITKDRVAVLKNRR